MQGSYRIFGGCGGAEGGRSLWGTATASCMGMRLYKFSSLEYETVQIFKFRVCWGGELRLEKGESKAPTLWFVSMFMCCLHEKRHS